MLAKQASLALRWALMLVTLPKLGVALLRGCWRPAAADWSEMLQPPLTQPYLKDATKLRLTGQTGEHYVVAGAHTTQKFVVEIIKPSHYDDDGYVIQWRRAFIPSNSLGCMYALAQDAADRQVLGAEVEIEINAYDECHTVIPMGKIIERIRANDGKGIVLLAGVQSNQFPRAMDLASEFRAAGIPVAIGGFHVSGCIAMLPELPADLQQAQAMEITMFAGEAEGRMDELLSDAYHDQLKPIYNYLLDLPDLQGQITPFLPREIAERYLLFTAIDAGRGCPFQCSFCTIINVQGRKSRFRDADDVEALVRLYDSQGIHRFFITDDNMARNSNWEAIFDRLIELRENEGLKLKFIIQVDTLCHKIPNFIEKAARAGCNRVFIGLENINPENLAASKKFQNRITEYRTMLQSWRSHRVVTYAGYILGFPADTPASIKRDIKVIQAELPIDILEFFILTPLPGSADHQALSAKGVWMDPDMNKYDLEHVTTAHGKMTSQEWEQIYRDAWHLYYSAEHIETLLRRAEATGSRAKRVGTAILQYYGSYRFEKVHPLQSGILRHKVRTTRRPGFPRENPVIFYPRRIWDLLKTYLSMGWFVLKLELLARRIEKDSQSKNYVDLALTPVGVAEDESLELYDLNDAAREAVSKARAKKQRKQPLPLADPSQVRRSA